MLEVKRKDNESFEGLIRRFNKKTLQSGKLIQAKKIMFFQRPLSALAQKQRAQVREKNKGYREYLRKIGKLEEWMQSKKKGKGAKKK